MDDNTQISDEARDKIYTQIADTMIEGLEAGTLSADESQQSSQYILDRLDDVHTFQEAVELLKDVSERWPAYRNALSVIEKEGSEKQDEAKIQKAQEQLHNIQ